MVLRSSLPSFCSKSKSGLKAREHGLLKQSAPCASCSLVGVMCWPALALSLTEHPSIIGPLGFCSMGYHEGKGCPAMVDTYMVCISSSHLYVLLSHQTLLTKKNSKIKLLRIGGNWATKCGALLTARHCVAAQVTWPWSLIHLLVSSYTLAAPAQSSTLDTIWLGSP